MKSFKRTLVLAGIVALSLSGVAHATGGPGDDSSTPPSTCAGTIVLGVCITHAK